MTWQASFARALRDADAPPPPELRGKSAADIERQFNVYRNNVKASLAGALKDNFPIVQQLVGEEFFAAMAQAYIRDEMPATPVLALYGGGFGDFIDGFPPASPVPYLGDIARLEYARQEAFYAADCTLLNSARLAEQDTTTILRQRLRLHPSLRVVASPYPIYAIWRKNTDAPDSEIPGHGETVLVSRLRSRVDITLLARGGERFFAELIAGACLGDAASAAVDDGGGDHLDTLMVLAIRHATDLLEGG